jgi:hypothetical protein
MKTYRKILVPSFSSCPSVAQLTRCSELAVPGDCKVRVVHILDRSRIFESDGPVGIFPQEELIASKVSDTRQRLRLLLERNELDWAQSSVVVGDPQPLLARELKAMAPELVIVTKGWGHVHRVKRAARQAGIPVPDILDVAADGLVRKIINALLPLSVAALRLPLHGGHHPAAG